jgi:hypothetical protein
MRFKVWLENDQEHPLQAWHRAYTAAQQADRRASRGQVLGVRNWASDKMLNDPVSRTDVVSILYVNGYSGGVHGRGGEPDIPAGDPMQNARWEVYINNPQEEKALLGQTAVVVDSSGGSFHEQWVRIHLYVIVDSLLDDDWHVAGAPSLEVESIGRTEIKNIKSFFKFAGVGDAIARLKDYQPNLPFPVATNDDPETYWNRVMSVGELSPKPDLNPADTYRDGDDYFKRPRR